MPLRGGSEGREGRGPQGRFARSVIDDLCACVDTVSNMARNVPHVHEEVADVARRVMKYRQASEAERLGAIAELTRRRVSFSGTFSATIAALIIASLVGGLAAYTSYVSLLAQVTSSSREDAFFLIEAFREMGATDQWAEAVKLAQGTTPLLADAAELVPGALGIFACATVLTLMWAWWRTRRASIAGAWLAVYAVEPERAGEPPARVVKRRGPWERLARRTRAPRN